MVLSRPAGRIIVPCCALLSLDALLDEFVAKVKRKEMPMPLLVWFYQNK